MILRIFFTILIFLSLQRVRSNTQELKIGTNIKNEYPALFKNLDNKIPISSLGNKYIILDFWSHICITCFQSFPKLDSLQEEFKEQLQLILVNNESVESTKDLFTRKKKLHKPQIPMISGDPYLSQRLPHYNVPYTVWIDKSGTIKYTTTGSWLTRANVRIFLKDEPIKVVNYHKTSIPSLFDSLTDHSLEQFSYISKCITDVAETGISREGFTELQVNCASLLQLYQQAYKHSVAENYFRRPGRIIIESKKITALISKDKHETDINKLFTYHQFIPAGQATGLYENMQKDLDRYFGVHSIVELRKVPSYILIRANDNYKLKTTSTQQVRTFGWSDEKTEKIDSLRTYANIPYREFSTSFGNYIEMCTGLPFVDAVNYTGNIDISFTGATLDSKNIPLVNKELLQYGLAVIQMDWPIEVLVLRSISPEISLNQER
ncbi:MAG: TlpA family protein disulfide reductase [Chitinophagaceae bacterium]|nr:MAG: TlpA family protein disulfide reductase [Chitinophagaceae bacterium]